MNMPEAIGFPPPLLGEQPQRLPVLATGPGWLALDKPTGCLIDAHPWNQDAPSLVAGIRVQAEAGKPELAPLAIETPYATHYLDVEATGVALIATNKEARGRLKETIGSAQAQFTFHFAARQAPAEEQLVCDLPLGEDAQQPRAAVERKLGKKSRTEFRLLGRNGVLSFWEARMDFPRPQQVRAHAVASGFHICGEKLFGEVAEVYSGDFSEHSRGSGMGRKIHAGLALRLVEIAFPDSGKNVTVTALPPKPWRALVRYFR